MPLCDVCSKIIFQPIETAQPNGPDGKKCRAFSASDTLLLKTAQRYREWMDEIDAADKDGRYLVAFLHPSFEALSLSVTQGRRTGRVCEFCEMIYDILLQTETRREHRAKSPKKALMMNDLRQWFKSPEDMELLYFSDKSGLFINDPPGWTKRISLNRNMRKSQAVWLKYNGFKKHMEGWPLYMSVGRLGMREKNALLVVLDAWADQFPTGRHGGQGEEQGEEAQAAEFESSLLLSDTSTASLRALRLIIDWILECLENHPRCQNYNQPSMPTRLLDLQLDGRDDQVALVDGRSLSSVCYVTLSHRWGKDSPPLQTTTENQTSHRKGILISKLPKTFQHAVSMARSLKLRYLWIDSLCILQDSELDKAIELPLMGAYYYGSFCNISAESAEDSSGGLFYPRNGICLRPQSLTCQIGNLSSKYQKWTVTPDLDNLYSLRESISTESVLHERAWIFQEQIFSTRTIHFGKGTFYFSCFSLFASETLPKGVPFDDGEASMLSYRKRLNSLRLYQEVAIIGMTIQSSKIMGLEQNIEHSLFQKSSDSPPSQVLHGLWYSAAELYSQRKLTFENDRLGAVSGLVEIIAKRTCDEYLAGLWKSDLIHGLCWKQTPTLKKLSSNLAGNSSLEEKQATSEETPKTPPVPKYIAPSWSWASKCPAHISFKDFFMTAYGSSNSKPPGIHTARVIDVYVNPSTPNPYGEVKNNAYLKLSAKLITTTVHVRNFTKNKVGLLWKRESNSRNKLPDIKRLSVEWDSLPPEGGTAYVLPLQHALHPVFTSFSDHSNDRYYFQGIVLVHNTKGSFQREGYGRFMWTLAALASLEEKEITIV